MMKTVVISFVLAILLSVSSCLLAQDLLNLGEIQQTLENVQETLHQVQAPLQRIPWEQRTSGIITAADVSRPWYFKMDWFDAAACSKIYLQVNNQSPRFLVEFLGHRPPTGAPIRLDGLRPGDQIKFLVKTYWHGRQYGPVASTDSRFFQISQKGTKLYYIRFEDAAGYDMAYNDGGFYLYQEGYGPVPNRYIWIKKFEAHKAPVGVVLSGRVHVSASGFVNSKIIIRDNTWKVYKIINLDFRAQGPKDYDFRYSLTDALPGPMYTAIWQVGFGRETDSRLRGLKGCIDKGLGSLSSSAISQQGLIAYYSFDDCSAQDKSNNRLNGTIYGSPECIGGLEMRSLYFNRMDKDNGCGRPGGDFIALPPLGAIFQKGITVCAWVKFVSPRFYEKILDLGNGPGEQWGYNVSFGRISTTNDIAIESWINADGNLNRSIGRLVYPGIINGQWQYYCASIDNTTRKMRLYINGELKAEKIGNPVANVSRSRNFIAHSNWCYNDPDFKGAIDEFRLYNRALSQKEIRNLYSKQRSGRPKAVLGNAFGSTQKNPFVFQGSIYFLPVGTNKLPDFHRMKPVGKIYNAVLNISPRSFLQGFPGITNRFEWFGLDYKGKIYIRRPGNYTFSLLSDDGSRLIIDGKTVIDNDGIHPPYEKIGSVYLGKGLHNIEVQYFQGPRQEVALVLSLIKGNKKIPFDIRSFAPVTLEESKHQARLTLGTGILFDFNSYSLRPEAIKVLDNVYNFLKDYNYKMIIVEGHTDNVGSSSYNLSLSQNRAQAVANYLIGKGISRAKIQIVGYGESRPRFPNDTKDHRARNRRVEIKVIKLQ